VRAAAGLRYAASIRSRVAGFARQHTEVDAELPHRPFVFAAGIGSEHEIGIGGAMQPAIVLDLGLELPRRPAGVAKRENGARRALVAGDGFENIEGR
jgi:hypothetical protein